MGVKERLQEFLKEEGISASEFSRRMGLSPAYLASMRKSMPEEKVERLTKVFPQLSRDWLLYGEGEMYRKLDDASVGPRKMHRHLVPLIPAHAQAGRFELYAEGYTEEDCLKIPSPIPGAEYGIQVRGDSMEPRIHNGTYLLLERINDRAFIPWGSPLVLSTENGTLVKLLYPSDKGPEFLEARSYNKDYPPFDVPMESIYGIYRILYKLEDPDTF